MYVTVPSNKMQLSPDSQTPIYLQCHFKKSYSVEKLWTLFLRNLYQCRLQNMLNKSIIKDVNYLRGPRRAVLLDKNWRCSAGMVGGKGRREAAPTLPFLLSGLDRLQSFRTLREKKQTPFFFSYPEQPPCSFILPKIETAENYCIQEA